MFWRGAKIYRPYLRKLNAVSAFRPGIMDEVYLEAMKLRDMDEVQKAYPLKANGHLTDARAIEARRVLASESPTKEREYLSLAAQIVLVREGLI